MQAGAGNFSDGIEVGHTRACIEVCGDAATTVMRSRYYRDRLARDIQATAKAVGIDGGEVLANGAGTKVRHVKQHMRRPATLYFRVDGACHDIAWRQLGARIQSWHETLSIAVVQTSAFPPDGLTDQKRRTFGVV